MTKRGEKYWLWSDCLLQSTTRKTVTDGGAQIEVSARTSRRAVTQLFVGAYQANGLALAEEYYADCPDESVEQALDWGEKRGRFLIESRGAHRAARAWPKRTSRGRTGLALPAIDVRDWSRTAFLAQINAAQARYKTACRKMVEIMKRSDVPKEEWEACRVELNAAIDERASALRINTH
jgi:hypothetical protein